MTRSRPVSRASRDVRAPALSGARARTRSGFALILALWFIVVIAVVAMQFRIDSTERRQLGLMSAERGRGRAAALGALNLLQAELEAALVGGPTAANTNLSAANAQDPWLGIDTLYQGTYLIDSVPVDVYPMDLGTQLNIDSMKQTQLQTFFGFIINDPSTAQKLAGAVLDWEDADTITRTNGAEAGQYMTDGLLTLPENAPFREVDQLLQVDGITPEIYDSAAHYLTTHGSGIININTADTVVLKSLPGMSTAILANILALRSNGRRISSTSQVIPGTGGNGGGVAAGGGRGAAATPAARGARAGTAARGAAAATPARGAAGGGAAGGGGGGVTPQQQQFLDATSVSTTEVELTFIARPGNQAEPTRLQAILTRNGTKSTISWMQW